MGVKTDQPGTGFSVKSYKTPKGFDIKVAQMSAKALGGQFEPKPVPSSSRQSALQEGDVDLIVATFSINNKRLSGKMGGPAVDFAGPYALTDQGFLVRKKDQDAIDGNKEWYQDRKICAWEGTVSAEEIGESIKPSNITPGDSAEDCIRKLKSEDVFAIFSDKLLLHGIADMHTEYAVDDQATVGTRQYWGIGIPKGHRKECNKIKDDLKKYIQSGNWDLDFAASFPEGPNRNEYWKSEFAPELGLIESFSCRDRI
ncbi:transporter substrate-binding domain-containing protein [Streptomyces sp. NPDC015032]|uniref:transporter substrate-binding domain-containing protein n=1 Tax=Streptomyces sp. NPDC015032 TaxID=3364937 RepID=UPI0036F712F7